MVDLLGLGRYSRKALLPPRGTRPVWVVVLEPPCSAEAGKWAPRSAPQ
jgi:hypothetical protein